MDLMLCGSTAFNFHRIPPQVLGLYPSITPDTQDPKLRTLKHSPLIEDLLGTPLHRIVNSRRQTGSRKLFVSHLMTHDAPPGALWESEHGFEVVSPEFTLLNLTTMAKPAEVLMAAYELCGSFAVFKPCNRAQDQLDAALQHKLLDLKYGWKRVNDTGGSPTDLWKRDPLIDTAAIEGFLIKAAGMRGIKRLRWAATRMTGVTASPFEAQTSMLLSLPRREGGWGLNIQNNQRISLSTEAMKLHEATCVYADILIETNTDSRGLIIECQGRSVHNSEKAVLSDAERATALTSMGYDVILLTYNQLKNQKSFESVARLIHRKAGLPFKSKTAPERAAELELRNVILVDWNELFKPALVTAG